MPFVQVIVGKIRDTAVELERKARSDGASDWDKAYSHGFFEALRLVYPSETVGMLIMDIDTVLDGEDPYTDLLPRLELRG